MSLQFRWGMKISHLNHTCSKVEWIYIILGMWYRVFHGCINGIKTWYKVQPLIKNELFLSYWYSLFQIHPWRKNGPFIFPHVPEARVVSNKNLGIKASRNVEILTFNGVIFEKMASKDFGKAYLVRVVCCQGKRLNFIFFGLGRSIDT